MLYVIFTSQKYNGIKPIKNIFNEHRKQFNELALFIIYSNASDHKGTDKLTVKRSLLSIISR